MLSAANKAVVWNMLGKVTNPSHCLLTSGICRQRSLPPSHAQRHTDTQLHQAPQVLHVARAPCWETHSECWYEHFHLQQLRRKQNRRNLIELHNAKEPSVVFNRNIMFTHSHALLNSEDSILMYYFCIGNTKVLQVYHSIKEEISKSFLFFLRQSALMDCLLRMHLFTEPKVRLSWACFYSMHRCKNESINE